ncbi:DUF5615 family PIN-like protein [uncultured Devosia sp.]|uniref:DUF5615 family PIN-like protein n=1 Tax=uncultured Devosia sp. TaxID=211434 RepID=UPI0035CAF1AA
MHFLLDAQLSSRLVKHFIAAGYASSHVYEHLPVGAKDPEIAFLANSLAACVVTKDADFSDLSRRGLIDHSVIWLRIENTSTAALWARIETVLPAVIITIMAGTRIIEIR